MPPGTGKASPREVMQLLENPLQVGYPASMDTDACLSFSVAAYQSQDIAHGHCEAYLSTLFRIEGRLSNCRDGKVGNLCQRAKVGYFPCSTQATHVAIPPTYYLGPIDGLKQTGIRL